MKKILLLFTAGITCLLFGLTNSCKKDSSNPPPTNIGTRTSFTEEFQNVSGLSSNGWVFKDNTPANSSGPYASWTQAFKGFDKGGVWNGFTAYSYTITPDEFAYSLASNTASGTTISSWMITPVLSVKNGDKISFYTRGDTAGVFTSRMQVLMNKSSQDGVGGTNFSVGGFTTVLFDINAAQAPRGYPVDWTKYEYTFSGISGNIDTRVAFRHYLNNATNVKGIGIDQFKFEVN